MKDANSSKILITKWKFSFKSGFTPSRSHFTYIYTVKIPNGNKKMIKRENGIRSEEFKKENHNILKCMKYSLESKATCSQNASSQKVYMKEKTSFSK